MLILGIDTSCDDTSASLLDCSDDGISILTNIVSGQSDIHVKYGGIVPELASRHHLEMIWPVVKEALAGRNLEDLSAVAVCQGPGLIGSLLVGCSFAKAVCHAKKIPLVAVNHLEGHINSVFLEERKPDFPFLTLIASGGHTSLYKVSDYLKYEEIGATRDDAAGEAYDKISKLMGLGYPGGPEIDRRAKDGNPRAIELPRAYLPDTLDFSFSGLKTAVRLALKNHPDISADDLSASFQSAVVDVLVRKCEWAVRKHRIKRITISGGVAANSELRRRMSELASLKEVEVYMPSVKFCTDNAAMIAVSAYFRFKAGIIAGLDLNPKAYLPLGIKSDDE